MELGHVIIDPSLIALGVGLFGAFGLLVWWLMRKRQKRVRLPTLRVMQFETRLLPRLVLRPPPLLAFLAFLVSALAVLGFALKPRTQVFTPFEPDQTRIHIFVDMSASVAGQVSLDDLIQRVTVLYTSLKESGRISLSTSHELKGIEPQSAQDIESLLRSRGFHRAGMRLGTAMKLLIEGGLEADRLFIVSDRDQHTWSGFNWRYLLDDMDVLFYDVSTGAEKANIFVNDARFLSQPSSPTMDWDVEIARRGGGEVTEGKLEATFKGKVLASVPWKLGESKQRLAVRATWPASLVEDVSRGAEPGEALVFRIEAKSGNALKLDDEFRTELLGLRQDVLVIGETAGERVLEDPANQLGVALSVLGFRQTRHDYVRQPGPAPSSFPFWVLVGGMGNGVDRFCPKSLQIARAQRQNKAGKQLAKDSRLGELPKVWLAPHALDANYKELCQCYSRLLLTAPGGEESPAYCEHIDSRAQWLGLLPSLGAKQVGGRVGENTESLAWLGKDAPSGFEVLAFTVPLTPLMATGINHAQMPILVRELLRWQNVLAGPSGGGFAWPRVEDIAETSWKPKATPLLPLEALRIRETNVPLGESLFAEVEPQSLPPRWTSQMDWSDKQLPAKKDREDPLPWIKLAALLAVLAMSLEALFGLGGRMLRLLQRRPDALGILLAVLVFGSSKKAEAKVEFNLVGYNEGPITLQTLAREVSHRTSIELEVKPNMYSQVQAETLSDPWLWVRDISRVEGPGGGLRPDIQLWLKRGGFLVIEASLTDPELAHLTERLLSAEPGEAGWLPLPPDHELMRSFYLLDALPSCNNQIWRGFQYDGRLAVLAVPYGFLSAVKDHGSPPPCANPPDQERSVRIFVNLVMVALATDYKKDQIHLPEILKRLR